MANIEHYKRFECWAGQVSLWKWVRILPSLGQFFRREGGSETAIQRLAETSPHLLVDLGFRRDPERSSEEQEVWLRDDREIVVSRRLQAAASRG